MTPGMRNRDSACTPPTERELRLAAEWMRVARLISASIQSRIDFNPDHSEDPLVRYAPLKLLLNDVYVRELNAWGDRETARNLRVIQRKKYAQLLTHLTAEARLHQRRRLDHMDRAESWNTYGEVFLQEWFIRLVIVRLHAALWLHTVSLPGAAWLASDACKNLRRLFPPAQVVPIRA
jgi:hypothetical protein